MLRVLANKFPGLLGTPVRFSWIAAGRYKEKDSNAPDIKSAAKKRIIERLGKRAKDFSDEGMDFMIGIMYEKFKGGDAKQTEDLLVSTIADDEFLLANYLTEHYSLPLYAQYELRAKERTEQRAQKDYDPDPEDAETLIQFSTPPKGINLRHFTQIIPDSLKTTKNILDMLPDNGICVCSLPDSFTVETCQKLFEVFGPIAKCTVIHDVNSILFLCCRLSRVRRHCLRKQSLHPRGQTENEKLLHRRIVIESQGSISE
eukprot:TRINITY_DN8232_c0_g2_i2.p1 TRINITY_DN8232_c0_g2~~TRINITY_DN8232_c0_g2_i2.p1  ORF type:complete len:258 (+),score=18.19 TRINITY_DN8232_c0_g2_i2:178-951(+)